MARTLEFYFDYGSPYSYLADTQVEAIARRAGATLDRKPMLLGGVFKVTGNHSPAELPAKSKWSAFDMPMWARHYGVQFKPNPFFPVNTLALMRGAARYLAHDGTLITYGPYFEDEVPPAPSNLGFDQDLRARDPSWGIRRLEDVVAEARRAGLELRCRHAMPANNLLLEFGVAD